jgi:formylglycine-generating enzyme required for sulfatase activity/curli biogenesis system outer membrane secretion channel CsgG
MYFNYLQRLRRRAIQLTIGLLLNLLIFGDAFAFDTLDLAQKIANSLNQIPGNVAYSTIAFSRIQGTINKETVDELIDYTENEIVQKRRFRLIDRSKLQLILDEQKFNLTGMVSQDTYKQLGKLLGVDLFVYGRYYRDTIVFKAIDVESSAIVWSEIFQLTELSKQSVTINDLGEKMSNSIRQNIDRLKGSKINQLSFWSIKSDFNEDRIIDYLSVAITQDGNFQVVDRENLQLILVEQKLSMEEFIDESKAKRMGELYGIDAFIYGRITSKGDSYIASLKMLNIYNGVIEWAKTIRFGGQNAGAGKRKPQISKKRSSMIYIPAGAFVMGSNSGALISTPSFKVPLRAYYIDRTEVSNQDYHAFVRRFKHRPPPSWPRGVIPEGKADHPVVMVSWKDADRYCRTQGKRLPKEVEWEKAFRGQNGKKYPWSGTKFYSNYARTVESGVLGPSSVTSASKDISEYGVQHLAGNVREWVDSYLKPFPGSRYYSPKVGREKVIRGGSWAKTQKEAIGWVRSSSRPTYGWKDVGFRCAKSAR